MTLKTGFAALGGILPAAGIAATYFAIGAGWKALGVIAAVGGVLGLVSYLVAAVSAETSFGEFMRGWLIGLNTALNAALGYAIVSSFAGMAGGIIAACVLVVINLLCLFAPVSQSEFFQGVIGWLNWIMPMGNFSFVDYKSDEWHKDHEAGHTLNLAAFGFLFHLIGALDENVLRRGNAYSERLAESNSTGMSGNNIPMWA